MDHDLDAEKFDLNDDWMITIRTSEISEQYPCLTSALTKHLVKPRIFMEKKYIIRLTAKVKIDKQFRADCASLKDDIRIKINATDLKHVGDQYRSALIDQLYKDIKEVVINTIKLDKEQYNWFMAKILLHNHVYQIPFHTSSCISTENKYFLYKIDGVLKFTKQTYMLYNDYVTFDTELSVDVIDLMKSDLRLVEERSRLRLVKDIDDLFQ